ncbi:phosphonate metabolism protein/1,5-bisphosphokinase (PRPP-forming) PhnN [Sulfitobacter donghicola]|uniref:Ribose 1,5-bisphosphate phosphokinase PhnN n=1 Tax=Sulfitobacter donghicola DSW-25 = KCTC 12864 = JCM 14565 TaxID=1300350 RepID=A0A073IR63_9RHOB|nr:phosphonate metabolism protein/1,5-bisphosphokinase (PRPP-forming) PhnN [Sulfitobacter donghicola]KEJ87897.1 ribose 1,5-bisphosphate phosphokinase [Sulfitobacter donghicola DSW-25 = KCTC 12864 = JCM 14565]KIN67256.1 ATP-binding protein [Sulfitobacter donghicola DSW-25 = KCTC 12864 = JCM 14565]
MSGRLIAIVGPSGVGKDSVMEALAAQAPRITLVRRTITRPTKAGGEAFEGVTTAEFLTRQAAGAYVLSWQAHDLRYGIPATVQQALEAGADLLVNLSRGVLLEAQQNFPRFEVINLTATRETLAARLSGRGRETAQQIAARLDRAASAIPPEITVTTFENNGVLDDTVQAILGHLYPDRA